MGNKLSCFIRQEEVHSQETPAIDVEIPVQEWNENEQPENTIETPDPSDVVEVRERDSPSCISLIDLAESPIYSRRESFRLKVIGEHVEFSDGQIKKNYRQFYDSDIPVSLTLNSDHINCIFHVSMYNSRKERTVDMTLISGTSLNPMIKHIIYWKDIEENSWRLNVFSEGSQTSYRISPMEKVCVWAMTTHVKNDLDVGKLLRLSQKPGVISVPSHIKDSAGCVMHITAYNLQLMKTLDMILIQGKKPNSESEVYVEWRDPNKENVQSSPSVSNNPEQLSYFST